MDFELTFLALVYSLLCVLLSAYALKFDIVVGLWIAAISLYTVPAIWTQIYAPQVIENATRGQFGNNNLEWAIILSAGSQIGIIATFKIILQSRKLKSIKLTVCEGKIDIFFAIISAYSLAFLFFHLKNRADYSYTNATDLEFIVSVDSSYTAALNLFSISPYVIFLLYASYRENLLKNILHKTIASILLVILVTVFVDAGTRLSNRNILISLVILILAFEYYWTTTTLNQKTNSWLIPFVFPRAKVVIGLVLATTLSLYGLAEIRATRQTIGEDANLYSYTMVERLIFLNDYSTPFASLIGVIEYSYVDPISVLKSNLSNLFPAIRGKLLQIHIYDLWTPGTSTRESSNAMIPFAEGYVAAGVLGPLYNSIIFSFGIVFLKIFSSTDNKKLNAVGFALVVSFLPRFARSQSIYIIKLTYIYIIPAFTLFVCLVGVRLNRGSTKTAKR